MASEDEDDLPADRASEDSLGPISACLACGADLQGGCEAVVRSGSVARRCGIPVAGARETADGGCVHLCPLHAVALP